ncbi:MAG TPA: YhdP family protein [Rhodanobacteraceae bacterium]|nr:YhdP family protein [Rhodanobacteraceae bacterium]
MLKPRWRHRLRRTWFTVGGALAVLAILLAVLMALGQLLLPLVAHYPKRVAHMLAEQLHQPVGFASMEGHWQPSGPLLVLHQVRIGGSEGQPALVLPTARVKLDFGALVWPSRHWINLRLSGLKLQLLRDKSGQWHVAGFGVAGGGQAHHVTLGDLPGNLWLDDMVLDIDDAGRGQHYRVRAGPIRVSNGSNVLRFAGLLHRGSSSQALRVVGEVRAGGAAGRLYLAADDADLGAMFARAGVDHYALTSGRGDVQLWLAWKQRRLASATAQADLTNLTMQGPGGKTVIPKLRGLVQYRRDDDHAQVLFAPGRQGAAWIDVSGIGADLQVRARAHDFDPGGWLALGALLPQLPLSTSHWLVNADPHVRLESARVHWSKAQGITLLDARFDHLGFAAADKRPGVDHLYGELRGDAEAISLHLPEQSLTLDYRPMFRWPFQLSAVGGNAVVWREAGDGWSIGSDGIDFTGKGIKGQVRGSVRLPSDDGAPVLNLYASLAHGDIAQAKQFWPVDAMSRGTVDWLDHGLVAGSIDNASVIMHGSMADWPFTDHQGRFEAHADISGLKLDYQPGWPHASDVAVQASFIDNGLLAIVTSGKVGGIKVKRAVASIPDFGAAELVLSAQGSGKGGNLMQFVRTSPIGKPHADVLDGLKLGGQGDFDFSMVVPLSRKAPEPFTLAGKVQLHDADLDAAAWKLHLGGLDGLLNFDAHGLQATGLTATYHDQPVTLDMNIGPSTGHPSWPLKVAMHGNFTMAQLVRGREELQSLTKIASGSAPFNIGFHIDNDAANPLHATQVLSVRSNLQGMALDLPAPLHKPAQALLPLDVQLGLPFAGGGLRVDLGNLLHARARLPADNQPSAVDVMLGVQAPQGPMPVKGIRIRGRAAQLDISGWVSYALSASGGTHQGMPPIDVDVLAGSASIFGNKFKQMDVKLHPENAQMALSVDSPDLKGGITVPLEGLDQRGIVARFDRLYWPSPEKSATNAAAPAPASSSTAPTPQQAAAVGVAPSSLPPLHVWVGDLRFGDARLGQARLESWPTAQGMHIDMLRTQSDSVHMAASGDWNGTAENSHTHMAFSFSAENLGKMLDAFGYDGLFIGGETRAHMDATWPGAPSSFELANVEGTLDINIGQGRIPEVKPGVGRLFGLMSIAELPRRLSLDFGDVFGKGFGFDSIKGHFTFHDGNAWTKDLAVKGSAANISVTGRVGFRAHDYDQYVLAIPHIGNSLPIVGAVVAGPVGAAAGLAVQGLLGKGLNRAASARYHITGSWDKPEIKLVEKHVPRPKPSAPAPATSTAKPAPATSTPIGQ